MTNEQIVQFLSEIETIIAKFEPLIKLNPEVEKKLKETKERLELINTILGAYIAISTKGKQIMDIMSYSREACPSIEDIILFIMEKTRKPRENSH